MTDLLVYLERDNGNRTTHKSIRKQWVRMSFLGYNGAHGHSHMISRRVVGGGPTWHDTHALTPMATWQRRIRTLTN